MHPADQSMFLCAHRNYWSLKGHNESSLLSLSLSLPTTVRRHPVGVLLGRSVGRGWNIQSRSNDDDPLLLLLLLRRVSSVGRQKDLCSSLSTSLPSSVPFPLSLSLCANFIAFFQLHTWPA